MSVLPPVVEKLTLAYRELFDVDQRIVQQFGPTLKELDISNNNLRELGFLKSFPKLEILVLDNNEVNSHTKFPKMERLHTLWVNSNQISNLIIFMDKLVDNTPNLRFLSMLKNEACPNYFNGKTLKEYSDYRYYVISRMPQLTCLDSTEITEQERSEAKKVYSSLPLLPSKPTAPDADLRTVIKKPEPIPVKKQARKKKTRGALPNFNNEGTPMGPPPTVGAAGEAGESEDDSSDFSSEGGIDSDDWTDEEVEEDNEIIVDTHIDYNAPHKK